MTKQEFTNEINWLINNSEVHYEDNDCNMMQFKGRLNLRFYESVVSFFKSNGGMSIKVGKGSINLILPRYKGQTNIEFNACLAK
jgi:hypothetical protein